MELQPCPFCGSAASIRGDFGLQQLGCSNFDCFAAEFGLAAHTPTRRRESIAAWNSRASRSPVVGAVGGEPIDLETLRERHEFILSACREAQSLASSRGWALDSILQSSGYQCENYTTGIGSCFTNGRTPEARYGADRCCHSCIAAKGLSGASPTAAGPMTEEQKPLTDERIDQAVGLLYPPDRDSHYKRWLQDIARPIARAIEAAHGIKHEE